MNISRLLVGTLVLCALPAFAQPDTQPANGLPYRLVSPEEAAKVALGDKPIALHLRDVTLRQALDELQKQSGVMLDTSQGGGDQLDKHLSLDIATRSFKEAFSQILEEADVKAGLRRSGNALRVVFGEVTDGNNTIGLQSGTGMFPVRLWRLDSSASKSVSFSDPKTQERTQSNSLSARLRTSPDVLIPVRGASRIRTTRAEDEQGRSLLPQAGPPFFLGLGESEEANVSLVLPSTGTASQKLAHFEGVAVYFVPTKRETWEVPDVLSAKNVARSFQSGGQTATVTLQSARKIGQTLDIAVQVHLPRAQGQDRMVRSPLLSFEQVRSSLRVVDANGQTLTALGGGGGGGTEELTVQARFDLTGRRVREDDAAPPLAAEPFKLVFNLPTEFVQTEVPFSFENLPLP